MSDNHFSYFKVENFKRFESFEMNDIGQFNLIVGDNNVGKTSLLEALMFDEDIWTFGKNLANNLLYIKHFDVQYPFFYEYLNKKSYYVNRNEQINFFIKTSNDDFKYSMKVEGFNINLYKNEDNISLNKNFPSDYNKHHQHRSNNSETNLEEMYSFRNFPLIPFGLGYGNDLSKNYGWKIQKFEPYRRKLVEAMQVIVPGLFDFDLDVTNNNALLLRINGQDVSDPLATIGEGSIKLFRILIGIIVNNNNRIMIDEIDAGIHHRRFIPFWKTIIKAAKDNNVQLFATTHNIECIKFFRDAFLEADMEDLQFKARVFRLVEHKNKQISAYSHNFEAFDHAIENENELR